MVVVFHDDHSGPGFWDNPPSVMMDTGLRRYDEVVLDTGFTGMTYTVIRHPGAGQDPGVIPNQGISTLLDTGFTGMMRRF